MGTLQYIPQNFSSLTFQLCEILSKRNGTIKRYSERCPVPVCTRLYIREPFISKNFPQTSLQTVKTSLQTVKTSLQTSTNGTNQNSVTKTTTGTNRNTVTQGFIRDLLRNPKKNNVNVVTRRTIPVPHVHRFFSIGQYLSTLHTESKISMSTGSLLLTKVYQ